MSAASASVPIGWTVSRSDVIAAGSRGSVAPMINQPMTWELSASVISHHAPGQLGTSRASPMTRPAATQSTAATAVASHNGPAGRRRSAPPWRSISRKPT